MNDPRAIAVGLVGPVEWESPVSGVCRCPGEAAHTTPTGARSCRIHLDGAPTVFCFHASCGEVIAAVNKRLRRELGRGEWVLRLPSGAVVRSGDVLQRDGAVKRREVIQGERRARSDAPYHADERIILESLRVAAERMRADMAAAFCWPHAQIVEDSPLLVSHRGAEEQFRLWLQLWPAGATVWIGDVFSSGKPEHKGHFRPVEEWAGIGPVMGNFTCGSSFKPGSYQRSNENCNGTRFLVVESDTLTRDEIGAVFAWLNLRLRFNLHCIIDTAGKSLHGWFDAPQSGVLGSRLKVVLTVFGCDPKLFTFSQPVRVPGALRNGKMQRLVWCREGAR